MKLIYITLSDLTRLTKIRFAWIFNKDDVNLSQKKNNKEININN